MGVGTIDQFTPTTPICFLNLAEAYRKAGQTLARDSRAGGAFDGSPIRYCYYHSIELYLKAALISVGVDDAGIRAIGHRFADLATACNERGLGLSNRWTWRHSPGSTPMETTCAPAITVSSTSGSSR
jgi:hypothetical protein